VLEFNYVVIQLNRLNWREYLKRDNPAATALMAKMGVKPEERPMVRAACLRILARLKPPKKKVNPILRFIDAYLPLTPEQEKKEFERELRQFSPPERRTAMEYITSWERKGIEKGRIEGRKEGMLKGKRELTLKLLTLRIGPLSKATQKRVSKLSLAQLDDLVEALLVFKSKADLDKWLGDNSPVSKARD
jgi:flagellar biosynthesis/type III secretory pathway protein FliH